MQEKDKEQEESVKTTGVDAPHFTSGSEEA